MNDLLEEELRASLRERAEAAPPPADLLTRVHRRRRALSARRHVVVAGVAAVATVAAVGAGYLVASHPWRGGQLVGPVVVGGPGRTTPPTRQPRPAGPPVTVTLGADHSTPPEFPFTPGWTPPGVGTAEPGIRGKTFRLDYAQPSGRTVLAVVVEPAAPAVQGEQVTVHGVRGTITTSTDQTPQRLVWQERPGQTVSVIFAGLSRADVLRYAEELTTTPLPIPRTYRFALVPVDTTVDLMIGSSVLFRLPGSASDSEGGASFDDGILVEMQATGEPAPNALKVRVGDHDGRLTRDEGATILTMDLGTGRSLVVQVPARARLSDDDLVRFAEGITVLRADAPMAKG